MKPLLFLLICFLVFMMGLIFGYLTKLHTNNRLIFRFGQYWQITRKPLKDLSDKEVDDAIGVVIGEVRPIQEK